MQLFQIGKLANKRNHAWKAHGPKPMIVETQFIFRLGMNIYLSTQWNCEVQSLKPCNLHMKWNMCTKGKNTKCCKGLRNDSWDAWQNSQKQRDRYSGRDLVFYPKKGVLQTSFRILDLKHSTNPFKMIVRGFLEP